MTYYDLLGVSSDAADQLIKKNYRKLVKKYHPDVNPTEEAGKMILKITEAYEILGDPYKREIYNLRLAGQNISYRQPAVDEREQIRWEYIRRKRQEEQERWEYLFRTKVLFYKVQRYFSWLFIAIGLIYTFDYLVKQPAGPAPIVRVTRNNYGEANIYLNNMHFRTHEAFFYEYKSNATNQAYIHFSGVLDLPVGISVEGGEYFRFYGHLHSLNNVPTILILVISVLLLLNKQYSDAKLTVGLLPFFVTMFLLLFTYMELSGFSG